MIKEKRKRNVMTAAEILTLTLIVCLGLVAIFRKPGEKPSQIESALESLVESVLPGSDSKPPSAESVLESIVESVTESLQDSLQESLQESGSGTGELSRVKHNLTASNVKKKMSSVKEKAKASGKSSYHSFWELWCQGAAGNAALRSGGCRVIAQAKMLVEMGLLDPETDNPDTYLAWARKKGYFMSGNSVDEYFKPDVNTRKTLNSGAAAVAWAKKEGTVIRQHSMALSGKNTAKEAALILELLEKGYYVIADADHHQCYIAHDLSIGAGKVYVLDSFSDCSYSPAQVRLFQGYQMAGFTTLYYYEIVK